MCGSGRLTQIGNPGDPLTQSYGFHVIASVLPASWPSGLNYVTAQSSGELAQKAACRAAGHLFFPSS